MIDVVCATCGNAFRSYPSLRRKFCSRKCHGDARRKDEIAGRYRFVFAPNHPLRVGAPYLAEHRMVLWSKIGAGPHPCHYCGCQVDWPMGAGPVRGALIADHLDRDTKNNHPDNLVPACTRCSLLNRGATVQEAEPHVVRKNGTKLRTEPRTCEQCGAEFHVVPQGSRPNRGRFCGKACSLAHLSELRREREAARRTA